MRRLRAWLTRECGGIRVLLRMYLLPCLLREHARGLFALRRRVSPPAKAYFVVQSQR
jgi:hypothetical protein